MRKSPPQRVPYFIPSPRGEGEGLLVAQVIAAKAKIKHFRLIEACFDAACPETFEGLSTNGNYTCDGIFRFALSSSKGSVHSRQSFSGSSVRSSVRFTQNNASYCDICARIYLDARRIQVHYLLPSTGAAYENESLVGVRREPRRPRTTHA